MFRFTIREIIWLTAVVALVLGLWAQRQEHGRQIGIVREHAKALRRTLADAEQNEPVYLDKLTNVYGFGPLVVEGETVKVAWELADAPIP
jgi:hypothetical protein